MKYDKIGQIWQKSPSLSAIKKIMHAKQPSKSFQDYLDFLRTSLDCILRYRRSTGKLPCKRLRGVIKNLHDADPFVVFRASMKASQILADPNIYH